METERLELEDRHLQGLSDQLDGIMNTSTNAYVTRFQ